MGHECVSGRALPNSPVESHLYTLVERDDTEILNRVRNFLVFSVLVESYFLNVAFFLSQEEIVKILKLLFLFLVFGPEKSFDFQL